MGDIEDQLVWWTVPMSDGARVRVHRLLLPALREVESNLADAAAQGLSYRVWARYTSGYSARTSVAHDGISWHGLGAAIDINSVWNPYRSDDRLITDMPDWFVEAWESAGFCWGGHWNSVKDPMHFSWMGPLPTPGQGPQAPHDPITDSTDFASPQGGTRTVVFGSGVGDFIRDVSGDGAPDVVRVRPWGEHAVLEAALSRAEFGECSVWRWWIDEPPAGEPHLVDVEGLSRPDLVFVESGTDSLVLHRYRVADGYERVADIVTSAEIAGDTSVTFGDFTGDGADDLWLVTAVDGGLRIEVWDAASGYTAIAGSGTVDAMAPPDRVQTADRDVDGRDDLLLVSRSGSVWVVRASDLNEVAETVDAPAFEANAVVGFGDYDGDGRPDMQILAGGEIRSWAGNSTLSGVSTESWFLPADFDCPEDTLPYYHDGQFADDEGSVFAVDIEWLAGTGVTRGCNPPFNDRFCPDDPVTRGQMAAFLSRALQLEKAESSFSDTTDSVFTAEIGALAESGITRGCNPPDNDRFCPDDPVTRGQMAAFLTRALQLPGDGDAFVDAVTSVFRSDIAALSGAGITRGCNPPDNDRFCPNEVVTRAQMAAFLHRAEGWLP